MHRRLALFAKAAQDFESIHAGQHDVQQHDVVTAVHGLLQPAFAVVLAFECESFALQEFGQQAAEFHIVVHQEDTHT